MKASTKTFGNYQEKLQRHLLPIEADLEDILVLTYAAAPRLVEPLLPPGVKLETFKGRAMFAIALTSAKAIRVAGLPRFMGQDCFLGGLRAFVKFRDAKGVTRRGLFVLRSYSDSASLCAMSNIMTHYHHQKCSVVTGKQGDVFRLNMLDDSGEHLLVRAHIEQAGGLPAGSLFDHDHEARRFAGPMPRTVDYEASSQQLVIVEDKRPHWQPKLVDVEVWRNGLFRAVGLTQADVQLAAAFFVRGEPYRWERGTLAPATEWESKTAAQKKEADHVGVHAA